MTFDGFPLVISWELTMACNLRCCHCASSAGLARANELTLAECLDICAQFPALLVREVAFTGGEPLLRPEWPAIATRLKKSRICTQIITNGLSLTPDTIAKMRDTGIDALGVSLDGREATHNRIRGCDGLYARVLAGIERVLHADIPVTVITTANAWNLDEIPSLFELLKSVGVKRWQIQPIFPLGRSSESADMQLSGSKYMQFGQLVHDLIAGTGQNGFKIELADSYGYATEFDQRLPEWRGCPAGLVSCGITSDGKVKGCLSLPDEVVEGDLRKHDLWDIWFAPGSFPYTRGWTPERLGSLCRGCDRAEQCRGGCSAMSYGSTGQFHNDPHCFFGISNHAGASVL